MIGVVGTALGTAALAHRRLGMSPTVIAIAVGLALVAPVLGGGIGLLAVAIRRFRHAALASRHAETLETVALEAGDLVGLGLAGGLSTAAAFRTARQHVHPTLVPALDRLATRMTRRGVVGALGTEQGPLAGMATALSAATASGAPVLPALDAHLRQEHHRRHTDHIEASRRLPVRLLIPLTLLVLPGFVLIAVGPVVVDSLARLSP